MTLIDLYYHLRPFIPRAMQIAVRRRVARAKRRSVAHCWPILESAGTPPPGWQGWPDGKRFALVLTHDVESQAGHDKCRLLMDMEERMGLRSSFNIVPELYRVSPGLRQEMVARGFEVGVHGLHHDGHLFRSRRVFEASLPKINRYLKEWNAVGFRAPSMLRNLNWIGEFGIEYDSSTFDTDPFEPQSEGAGTVFPFIVRSDPHGRAYVELPYTLPQDSTLFIILGETSPRVWKEKIDWIARCGGMALINTHPDYMSAERDPSTEMTYPAEAYREFLDFVAVRHAGQFWHALPRDVARFWAGSRQDRTGVGRISPVEPAVAGRNDSLRGKNALMIVFSEYPEDPRVRRAAEALTEAGMEVDVVCLREADALSRETVRGVRVYRVPLSRKRSQKGRYVFEYAAFGFSAFCLATWLHVFRRYVFVHVHNMPDALVFSALVPRFSGARIALDLHDPMPEVFMAKYSSDAGRPLIRTLLFLERLALRFADLGFTPNIAFRNLFIGRSCSPQKMHIVMNSPQEHIFYFRREPGVKREGFVLMYHGTIVQRHGLDLAVAAVAQLRTHIPGLKFHVYGSGDAFIREFLRLIDQTGAGDIVHYHGSLSLEAIAGEIRGIDLGIIPNRRSAFTDLNFPTRIFEYLAVGKPVIAPRTPGIRDYFDEDSLFFFEPGSASSLASAIQLVYEDPLRRDAVLERGRSVYARHTWQQEKRHYCNLVADLCDRSAGKTRAPGPPAP